MALIQITTAPLPIRAHVRDGLTYQADIRADGTAIIDPDDRGGVGVLRPGEYTVIR
jgi:hypothetical protein